MMSMAYTRTRHKHTIIGIDPGIARTGFGIVAKEGVKLYAIEYGCIFTKTKKSASNRLFEIYQELLRVIKKYKPDELAIERLFFAKNVKTALTVSEARGAILLLAGEIGLPVKEFTPLQVKQALTGFGRADKTQMQKMVKLILGLSEIPKPDDAADALAIALCAHQFIR